MPALNAYFSIGFIGPRLQSQEARAELADIKRVVRQEARAALVRIRPKIRAATPRRPGGGRLRRSWQVRSGQPRYLGPLRGRVAATLTTGGRGFYGTWTNERSTKPPDTSGWFDNLSNQLLREEFDGQFGSVIQSQALRYARLHAQQVIQKLVDRLQNSKHLVSRGARVSQVASRFGAQTRLSVNFRER